MATTEQLSRGQVYNASGDHEFNKIYHLSGVPREFWHRTADNVAFQTYKHDCYWIKGDPLQVDSTVKAFEAKDSQAWFEGFINTARGFTNKSLADYAGMTIGVTSQQTATGAQAIASVAAMTLLKHDEGRRVRWINAADRGRGGFPIGVDWEDVPDLVVLDGLHPDPSKELYETVERVRNWAVRFAPIFLVGSGATPLALLIDHYRITPHIALMGHDKKASIRSFG